MAGKSNRKKNKEKQSNLVSNASELNSKSPDSAVSLREETTVVYPTNGSVEEVKDSTSGIINEGVEKKGNDGNINVEDASPEISEGEVRLYPVSVKSMSGEKQELQLTPGDSVMDIRQFLLDAPETCFFTCYDLILHAKDGSVHHLEDYNEISEVVDITLGGCSIEMVPASYDDRSIRSHVRRTRELLSLSNLHASLSTSLAMQHESAQQKNPDAKEEIQEPDGMGFMEDITDSLCNLVAPQSKDIRCLECVTFSSFNPPPSYRRLVGDLIYLDAVTLEGNKYCITGMTKGFYVNASTGLTLDPKHLKSSYEATTLVELLQKVSSKFKKGFREILDRKASAHPFENVQSILRPNLWLGVYPVPDHKRDEARAEDAFTLSYGSELIGMQRDWNEELQSCRDFPHTNVQERMMRDRALYKVTGDFVDAAINGAIGVVNRCIPPINPVDPEGFHMYVHNNIFFSFAIDADLGLVSKIPTNSNSKTVGQQEKTPLKDSGETDTSANKVTELEAQLGDSEQATYASANNDLKGTKAFQEADVAGLYNLAMAIIDYRGHRVVAQSIIPGILQGDKTDSLLYGSVDNGKKICWNESFHSKVLEAAKHLHLKEHTVLDASGNAVKLAAPVECKGIIGSDDRHYLLDLMRVTPRDANYDGPGSRFCVLRPELINLYCQAEATKPSDTTNVKEFTSKPGFQNNSFESHCASSDTIVGVETGESTDVHNKVANDSCISEGDKSSKSSSDILLNPNVFTEFKLGDSEEEIAADESSVRKASSYLIDVAIPKYVEDLCNLDVSPMDGQTLTDTLHSHGINIRYLGKVANMVKHLPHLWNLFSMEIIVRSAKHILKNTLRDTQDHEVGPAISHFLSCFIGNVLPNAAANKVLKKDHTNVQSSFKSIKGQTRRSNATALKAALSTYLSLTSEGLWSTIQEFAKFKYQFELPEDARSQVKKVAVLRNLCQKVGISIASRKYDFDSASPFQISDILNVLPVVKHSIPVCSLARDIFEAGKFQLSEGKLNEAYTHFSEAFSILQQVTGPMHKDVANCCRYLAMVLYHAGDLSGAITQQHKELIINERCLGLDHPDTAHSYGNMALFYHGLSQTELALHHMSRTLLLLSLSSGPDHPDVAATFINIAMMYQDLGKMNTALRYLQEALKKNERLLGADHIQTAVCYHALAIAFNSIGAYKLSHQHEKSTYDILAKQLGKEDPRTQDSENWIKIFKMREAQANAQKQKGQAADSASAQKAIDILKAHPDLIKALQATNMGSGNLSSSSVNKPLNSPIKADAAHTATSARKTAAARGLPARQSANPVQKIPLNKKNTSTDSNSNSNLPASNGSSNDQAPVGLGSGLASLDSKKQKQKQLKKSM